MRHAPAFELRGYQEDGVEFLLQGRSRLLADEMGLGKTVQVAVALERLRARGQLRKALVVCPASLLSNWQHELKRFGPDCAVRTTGESSEDDRRWLYRLPIPITVTSYESLRQDFLPVAPLSDIDVVVFDEAQRLKNRDSTTSIAARRVEARRRWLLSATPLENRVSDLGSLAEVMRLVTSPEACAEDKNVVTEAFQGNFLRRRKVDVLPELPPLINQELFLRLTAGQLVEYDGMLREHEWNGSFTDLLALITRLKLICNRGSDGSSVKLDALNLLLEDSETEAQPSKFIVISQYTDTLNWLAANLPIRSLLFTGGVSKRDRDKVLEDFRSSRQPVVLLLSLKAGGVGLNIVEATHVVLFDRWWTPAAEAQAIARAHRFGRTQPILVYSLRVLDTVEDRIVEVAGRKTAMFDDLVNGTLSSQAEAAGWNRHDLLEVLSRA